MKKINIILTAALIFLAAACTNMNPDVKFVPEVDADAFCAIGKKDSKVASRFWNKVEAAYTEKMMFEELEKFEEIITKESQAAAQEYPVRVAQSRMEVKEGEVSYYPDQDAETYLDLMASAPEKAAAFLNQVIESYNADGLYEDLEIFMGLCEDQEK